MTEDRLAALERHFEEQYGKLELPGSKRKKRKRGQDDAEPPERVAVESEKDRENDLETTREATVIAFTEHEEAIEEAPITTHKSFMSSNVPKPALSQKKTSTATKPVSDDDETVNLQNDIALQRLLRESNLLSEYATKDDPGRIRHVTLDARISHLGGKEAPKGRMPTRMRQGLESAKKKRQEKKEQEAQEAGILMPVERKVKVEKPRERGLKTTSGVGKFKNGMLKVSERDIRKVNQIGSQVHRRGRSTKKLFK